jgi:hypothetical protein
VTQASYDVAVVGAGPGGSAAAITLARAGLRVALLDRQAFPRTKPCGDLIGCGGVALARTLGVDAEMLAPYRPLRGAVVIAPDTRPLVLRSSRNRDDARVIPRHVFDTALSCPTSAASAAVSCPSTGPKHGRSAFSRTPRISATSSTPSARSRSRLRSALRSSCTWDRWGSPLSHLPILPRGHPHPAPR